MLGLIAQIKTFFLTLLLGMFAGIIFHYYQLTIRALQARKFAVYLLDLCFWLLMILLIAIGMLLINQGELRIYIFLVLLAGSIFYFKMLAQALRAPLNVFAKSTAWLLQKSGNALTKPFFWLKKKGQDYWQRRHTTDPPDEN